MTLEDFKDVYKNAPLLTKLNLLMEVQSRRADAQAIAATERWNENAEAERHWVNEHRSASAKAMWLFEELKKALKAQEPRVMTLEEVKASKGNDIYLELSSCPDDTPYITAATLDGVGKYGVSFYHTVCNFCNYGRRAYGWRCWTSRPTEAQREATPWN
jgi:hypothetical protein